MIFYLKMYIPASGQLVSASDNGDPSGNGVITYIQPSMTGGQTQVLMAVSEEDSPPGGNSVRIRAKEAAAVAGNLLGRTYICLDSLNNLSFVNSLMINITGSTSTQKLHHTPCT